MVLSHDEMLALRHEGKPEEALRVALAFMSEDASDLYSWYSAASLCLELGGDEVGLAGLASAGAELAESGNLPMALVCIREIDGANGDSSDLIARVALLYGRGSMRVKDRVLPPPPLPPKVDEGNVMNFRPEKEFLIKEADRLMNSAAESASLSRGMGGEGRHVPFFPMFGALGMEGFLRLGSAFQVKLFSAGDVLMQQGKTSDELFLLARGEVTVVLEKQGKRTELAVLGPGALMGEMGMVARTPRSATVEARTAGIALVAAIDEVESIAGDIGEVADAIVKFCEIRMMENLMSTSPILQPLEPRHRAEVVRMFNHLYLEKGVAAIERGDEPKGIFLIVNGELAVVREPDKKKVGAEAVYLATLKTGDVFGEISTVMNKPATATVRAAQDAALLFLPRDRFMELTRRHPALFQKIYEISAKREAEIALLADKKAFKADDLIEE